MFFEKRNLVLTLAILLALATVAEAAIFRRRGRVVTAPVRWVIRCGACAAGDASAPAMSCPAGAYCPLPATVPVIVHEPAELAPALPPARR